MQRYFVNNNQIEKPYISIIDTDFHHIKNVMRMRQHQEVIVCDQDGKSYLCSVETFDTTRVMLRIKVELAQDNEFPVSVTIAHGVVRKDKAEETIRRLAELGASKYIGVQMERSIIKVKQIEDKYLVRLDKIIKEACEQAHRNRLLRFLGWTDLSGLLKMRDDYDVCLFAYEQNKDSMQFKSILRDFTQKRVLVLIGPEGGISSKEAQRLITAGFIPIGLGNRILRTETAPLFVMSALVYELEMRESNES